MRVELDEVASEHQLRFQRTQPYLFLTPLTELSRVPAHNPGFRKILLSDQLINLFLGCRPELLFGFGFGLGLGFRLLLFLFYQTLQQLLVIVLTEPVVMGPVVVVVQVGACYQLFGYLC